MKFLWSGQAAARPGYLFAVTVSGVPRRALLSCDGPKYMARPAPSFDEWSFIMDKQLQALLYQQWSNNACRGYVIWAMENCGFNPDDIQRVISELHYVFDMKSIEEADEHYCSSPY